MFEKSSGLEKVKHAPIKKIKPILYLIINTTNRVFNQETNSPNINNSKMNTRFILTVSI